jgi:hypothetical protein
MKIARVELLQEGQQVIRGTISTDASNVRIKVNNQELVGEEVEITHGGGKYRATLKTPLQEGQKVEVIQVLSGKDSSPAVATVVKKGPETKGLSALLGLSLVVYGSIISFLVARLVTYENWEKIYSLTTLVYFPILTPFILSAIVIYVVIEFWRVANTTTGAPVTTGLLLYDILALLFALLALQGFYAGMQVLPTYVSPGIYEDIDQKFCARMAFGCFCLATFFALAIGRFWSTFGLKKARWVIGADSIGVAMSLLAGFLLRLQPPMYGTVFFMTFIGFATAVGYLSHDLRAPADGVVPESLPKSKAEPE